MLKSLLEKKKSAILDRWVHLILDSYPADTSRFLKKERDRFQNPVGHTILKRTKDLLDALQNGMGPEGFFPLLEDVIKIRSVQDFSPSQAVGIIFLLKKAIREKLAAPEALAAPDQPATNRFRSNRRFLRRGPSTF